MLKLTIPVAHMIPITGMTVYEANNIPSPKDNATAFTLDTISPFFFFQFVIGFSGWCSPNVKNLNASAFEVLVEFFQHDMKRMFSI